jgi:coenzyme F420-reducing hydrogenase beta subunit
LIPDEEGFYYPQIDKNVCVNCGICEKICPVEHPTFENTPSPKVYAALINDEEERKKSSSGGMFYAIACWIIKQGGVVYGATIDKHLQVYHIGVDTKDNLSLLRGSKYVQSALNDIYAEIKKNLQKDRWCYFVGTPCQVAGLKAFLRKDYDKLLTSDLVCHGVPSQWLFDQHIAYLEKKYKGKVSDYQFRDNEKWGGCEIFNLTNPKGKVRYIKHPSYVLSPFLYSFMYAMTYRYSCYDCKFAKIPRQGDITLADYWGVKKFFPDININSGVSLILSNSEKGDAILINIEDKVELRKSSIEDGAKFNGNLVTISKKHNNRDIAYSIVKKEGYRNAASSIFKNPHSLRDKIKLGLMQNRVVSFVYNMIHTKK